ncbi:hypothetical protein C8J57DRAFT_1508446 [Mycena rebaudengoi]|nr:hypothetical protein C8J57DRAFT_1508446 [Mycena rebaudengoi]
MSNASAAQAIFFQNYCHLFGVAFLIWDYIITIGIPGLRPAPVHSIIHLVIDVESQYLWKRAKTASAYWFFAIRYGALTTNIPVVVFSFVTLPKKPFVISFTLMILRIWALYSRRARVLWWLIGIASSFIAIAVWSMHEGRQHGFPLTVLPGCHLAIDESASYRPCWPFNPPFSSIQNLPSVLDLAGPWECLFAFDAMIFGMTIYKGYVTRRDAGGANMPIHRVLVRDGAMYFAAMALANLANIVTFFINGVRMCLSLWCRAQTDHPSPSSRARSRPSRPGALSTLLIRSKLLSAGYAVPSMSVVMMSRLMLNLHERTEVGVLTELRISGIDGELAFAEMESLPHTA